MKIYIASSWKNQHAVEMLTDILRAKGHTVEHWMTTERAEQSFKYDTEGAVGSELVVYIAPSGIDAWAEVGAAYGLWAKGEQAGLMRKMVVWFADYRELVEKI